VRVQVCVCMSVCVGVGLTDMAPPESHCSVCMHRAVWVTEVLSLIITHSCAHSHSHTYKQEAVAPPGKQVSPAAGSHPSSGHLDMEDGREMQLCSPMDLVSSRGMVLHGFLLYKSDSPSCL
jgi:hypothetical protein